MSKPLPTPILADKNYQIMSNSKIITIKNQLDDTLNKKSNKIKIKTYKDFTIDKIGTYGCCFMFSKPIEKDIIPQISVQCTDGEANLNYYLMPFQMPCSEITVLVNNLSDTKRNIRVFITIEEKNC